MARTSRPAPLRVGLALCLGVLATPPATVASSDRPEPPTAREARPAGAGHDRVRSAELRQNLLLCLAGTYADACRHELLSPAEVQAVAEAEAQAARRTASRAAAVRAGTARSPVDPYAAPGSPLPPARALDGHALGAPLSDPRAGTSLAKPIPDEPRGPAAGARWPGGATDPAAMYGTPFRRDSGAIPYGARGPAVLTPP